MTPRERDGVVELIEAISTLTDPAQTRNQLLSGLCALTGMDMGHFLDIPDTMSAHKPREIWRSNLGPIEQITKAHDHYVWKHPVWPYVEVVKVPVYSQVEVLGTKGWRDSEYYQDFGRRFNFDPDGFMNVNVRDPHGNLRWGIGLARSRRSRRKPHVNKLLINLSSHIGRGLANLESWNVRLCEMSALSRVIDHLEECVVAMQGKLLIACSPPAASALGLARCAPERNLHLQEFLRIAGAGLNGSGIHFSGADGRSYCLNAVQSAQSVKEKTFFVRMIPFAITAPDLEMCRRAALRHGLAERESQVFAHMAMGLQNKQIARELRISYDTVRAHVRNIFTKLNVSSRVEAINAVSRRPEQ